MKTISTMQVTQLLDRCESLGAPRAGLLQAAHLTASNLSDPEARLPMQAFMEILEEAQRMTGDSLVGIRAGMACDPRGVLVHVARVQRSFKDAFARFARYARLAADAFRVELRQGGRDAWLCVALDGPERDVLCLAREYVAAFLIRSLDALARPFRPRQVRFPHAPRAEVASYERLLGAPVRFRQAECSICIPRDLLEAPLATANEVVARILDEQLERRLLALGAGEFRDRVERLLEAPPRHGRGRPVRSHVARELGVSVRTLQRRLEAEGCTFRAVRERVVQRVASELLALPSLSLTEVALRVGFADEDAFAKAWKRWTGRTPREERRRVHA